MFKEELLGAVVAFQTDLVGFHDNYDTVSNHTFASLKAGFEQLHIECGCLCLCT